MKPVTRPQDAAPAGEAGVDQAGGLPRLLPGHRNFGYSVSYMYINIYIETTAREAGVKGIVISGIVILLTVYNKSYL